MKTALLILPAVFLGMAITPVQASTYTFGWVTAANANSDLGLSYSQTYNAITLTAYGLTASSNLTAPATAGPDLYAKKSGTSETGLGMSSDPGGDHEISAALHDGIQIDFSDALSKTPNATVTLTITSSQSGEGWAIYGSNTLLTVAGNSKTNGALGEPLLSGTGNYINATTTVTLPDWGEYTYYALMATNADGHTPLANVLLDTVTITGSVTTQSTPEPNSMLMAGTALIAIGILLRKARRKA